MRYSLFLVIAILAMGGCNTLVQNSYQKIEVKTPGVVNADCTLETETNKYRVITPGTVLVERSRLPMTVSCEKANYYTGFKLFNSEISMAASKLNVFNGIVPGTAYDVASNSVYHYPDTVTINLLPKQQVVQLDKIEPVVLQKKSAALKKKPDDAQPLAQDGENMPSAPKEADKTISKSLRK